MFPPKNIIISTVCTSHFIIVDLGKGSVCAPFIHTNLDNTYMTFKFYLKTTLQNYAFQK